MADHTAYRDRIAGALDRHFHGEATEEEVGPLTDAVIEAVVGPMQAELKRLRVEWKAESDGWSDNYRAMQDLDDRLRARIDAALALLTSQEWRLAFSDPGAHLPRGDDYTEPIHHWQRRAAESLIRRALTADGEPAGGEV